MENIEDNQDVDALARQQAALAAQARARGVAEGIAQAHAEGAYDAARQNATGDAERFPDGRPRRWDIPPPPPPPEGVVQGVPVSSDRGRRRATPAIADVRRGDLGRLCP